MRQGRSLACPAIRRRNGQHASAVLEALRQESASLTLNPLRQGKPDGPGSTEGLASMPNLGFWRTLSGVFVGVCLAMVLQHVFIRTSTALVIFALGLLNAWLMSPVLDALERRGWCRAAATWIVTIAILAAVTAVGIVVVPRVLAQIEDAANHWHDYSQVAESAYHRWRQEVETYALQRYPDIDVVRLIDARVDEATAWLSTQVPALLEWVSQRIAASLGVIAALVMLSIISFHFMNIIGPLRRDVGQVLGTEACAEVGGVEQRISAMIRQYLLGMLLVSVALGMTSAGVLYVLGLIFGTKYALIIGVVTGATYVIPYVGPLLSAASAGFIGYVTCASGSPWAASFVSVLAMCATNQIFDSVIMPRVVGKRVGLHPLVILFALMMGLAILGIPGMVIATPVAASLKILLGRWLPLKAVDPTKRRRHQGMDIDVAALIIIIRTGLLSLCGCVGPKAVSVTSPEETHR